MLITKFHKLTHRIVWITDNSCLEFKCLLMNWHVTDGIVISLYTVIDRCQCFACGSLVDLTLRWLQSIVIRMSVCLSVYITNDNTHGWISRNCCVSPWFASDGNVIMLSISGLVDRRHDVLTEWCIICIAKWCADRLQRWMLLSVTDRQHV